MGKGGRRASEQIGTNRELRAQIMAALTYMCASGNEDKSEDEVNKL